MKITDHLVQLLWDKEYDRSPLNRESFPVNMRLYKINPNYRKCIFEIIRYMDEHLRSHFEDYQDPRGIAAANLGFPLKIIGYRKGNMPSKNAENQFCLNPKIIARSPMTTSTVSNCGSLRLKEPVSIDRYNTIDFEYYDLEGTLVQKKNIARYEGGFTIQHEIDQTEGRTIIDLVKKKNGKIPGAI